MDKTRITYLYNRYLNDRLTVSELSEFRRVLTDPIAVPDLEEVIDSDLRNLNITEWPALAPQKLGQHFIEIAGFAEKGSAVKLRSWKWISTAAAIAVMIFSISLFYFNRRSAQTEQIAYNNDIAPGKVGATLTLANGKKISLAGAHNGELAKEAGISISKTADGQVVYEVKSSLRDEVKLSYNRLTTAKGETYILTLPDQSKVWLNAASSLTYSAGLMERGVRRVKLDGEAYFEIAKDKSHPFIVESGNQQVEVLGTHFNVNAYEDEKAFRTTLLEGSVKISDNGESKILEPGSQATNIAGSIKLNKVDAELAIAWKNNKFIFERLPIEEVMRMIERWYNVEVIYQGAVPSGTYWGSVSRFDNISKALIPLEATGNVHFKIEERRIYVSR